MVVTILNVEPGGWGAENAMPASARISAAARVERGDAAEPARQRAHGRLLQAACRSSSARAGPHAASLRASTREPGAQRAAGRALDPALERPLEPVAAHRRVAREAAREQRRAARRRSALAATVPAIDDASSPSGDVRRSGRALGQHLAVHREDRRALGRPGCGASAPPLARRPGKTRLGLPVDRLVLDRQHHPAPQGPEHPRADGDRHARPGRRPRPARRPDARRRWWWRWRPPVVGGAKRRQRIPVARVGR